MAVPGVDEKVKFITDVVTKKFVVLDVHLYPNRVEYILAMQSPEDIDKNFEFVRHILLKEGYIPFITTEKNNLVLRVFKKPPAKYRGVWLNIILLIATLASVIFVGAGHYAAYNSDPDIFAPRNIIGGIIFFALPLMAILASHEMSHYFAAKKHGLSASLPFFIPAPTLFGTLGAFISIRDPIPNRKALLDVGFAGPIAGFLVAIPIALIGNYLGAINPPPMEQVYTSDYVMYLNLPLIYEVFNRIIPPSGVVHPTTLAAWVGFVVTAINLLPIGQLDGGHIARALLGEKAKYVGYAALAMLFIFGLVYPGWLLFALIVVFLGIRHPPPLNDITPLDTKRKVVGIVAFLILAVSITPVPITVQYLEENFSVQSIEPYNNTTLYLVENYSGLNQTVVEFKVTNIGERISTITVFAVSDDKNVSARIFNGSAYADAVQQTLNISENSTYKMLVSVNSSAKPGVKNLTVCVAGSHKDKLWIINYRVIVLEMGEEVEFYPPQPVSVPAGMEFNLTLNNTLPQNMNVKLWFFERKCVAYINDINVTGTWAKMEITANSSKSISLRILSRGYFHLIAQYGYEVAVIEIEVR